MFFADLKETIPIVPANIEAQVIELKFENERLKEKVAEVNRKEFMEMKDEMEELQQSKKSYEVLLTSLVYKAIWS